MNAIMNTPHEKDDLYPSTISARHNLSVLAPWKTPYSATSW